MYRYFHIYMHTHIRHSTYTHICIYIYMYKIVNLAIQVTYVCLESGIHVRASIYIHLCNSRLLPHFEAT